ncbi:AAA family ATPase [uncultured Desulfuromonas sp.]|uniref:bifunctional aminoglycoside phosphotransferase/ATP-binding protein n=1 Tax=uncultured Desulfuromonas sp. TaxID=181013 RepID=UPI002AAA709D|nr:AAA family ATPase [uncultured Desulfuromonas sp.]
MHTPEDDFYRCLIDAMLNGAFYDHPVSDVTLIETHISWVFLASDFAYKVKKPLDFGFLDFSTLSKRKFCCEEEVRLNRRLAPEIYLDVVAIGGDDNGLCLNGRPTREYAVKMRRFDQPQQLDEMLRAGRLSAEKMDCFAEVMAAFHDRALVADPSSHFGTAAVVYAPVAQNFYQIRSHLPDGELEEQVTRLEVWSRTAYERLQSMLTQRKAQGFIRECHGDAHLANMAWYHDAPVFFDCIEFNADLRWIDVMNEVAFLVMDLDDRGRQDLGWRCLNRYLEKTGDYAGGVVLTFYKVYRALVRAKVACLRLAQSGLTDVERAADMALVRSYLNLAEGYTQPRQAQLIITHGLSGSGKSTFVNELAPQLGALCLHSDHERKRLFGLAMDEQSRSPIRGGIYSADASRKTYTHLFELADTLLSAGLTTIVDATFLKQQDRERFCQLAKRHRALWTVLDFRVPEAELRRRIRQRTKQGTAVSEAGEDVLNVQIDAAEPLDAAERPRCISISAASDLKDVVEQIANF